MPKGVKVQVLSGLPRQEGYCNMDIKETNSQTLYKEYALEIPYSEIEKLIDNKIKDILPTISLPGFRKGKAPINIVKKKYENNVLSEVIDNLVKDKTKKLIEDKKIKPIRTPRVNLKKYEKDKPVEIEIKIDLEPEIKLADFANFTLNKYEIELDSKTLNNNYDQFLKTQKNYKAVNLKRSIKMSDKVFINISTTDVSVPDFLKSQKNLPIITDSDYQILPDISKKLIDKNAAQGQKIKLSFDLREVLKSKTKKEVEFEIEVLNIEESMPFKIDDEFLKKIGVKSEDDLKENLKKNMKYQYDQTLNQIEKKELMDILDKEHDFDLPEGLIEEEFHSIWHQLEHAKKDNKLDEDDKNLTDDELKKRYKNISNRRVKLALLIQFIARNESIAISENELKDGMVNYASQYPGQEKQIIEYFKKNPSSIENIRGPLIENKVIENIISKAKINNKKLSIEEHKKLQDQVFKLSGE